MKRREREGDWRYLTCSCADRLPLFEVDWVKRVFLECLAECRERTGFQLAAWVIMPEHVHLLLRPDLPKWPVSRVLWWLKRESSRRILGRWSELRAPILHLVTEPNGRRRFWLPGGGYDRNIFSGDEFEEKVNYIHRNPIRRGLVEHAHEWPWSSRMACALDMDLLTPREVLEPKWAARAALEAEWRERVMREAQSGEV